MRKKYRPKPNRFSTLTPEQQDQAYDKIVDDRDTALKVARDKSEKLSILSERIVINNGWLEVVKGKLSRHDLAVLSECLGERR